MVTMDTTAILLMIIFYILIFITVRGLIRYIVRTDPKLKCNRCKNFCEKSEDV